LEKESAMKLITIFMLAHLISFCARGNDGVYIASTPADAVIRPFLGIPKTDSVDFVRWKISISGREYQLQCNYGIGKNNTNGFINGGKKIAFNGSLTKENNYYILQNGPHSLHIAELNEDLLHLMDASNQLLNGNGGWSYTLSSVTPVRSNKISTIAGETILSDSLSFQGRTPCKVPGIIPAGMLCYKLKWWIVLYSDKTNHQPAGYKVFGTAYRKEGGKRGNWKLSKNKNGRIVYQLNDDDGNGFIYLLKLDENILVITDAVGNLLVGDEDFSYTLNRVK
jgi:hypothetical protein